MFNCKPILLCLSLAVATPAWAESAADGTWDFSMSSPFGTVAARVSLQSEGSSLSGEFDLGNGRKLPIEEGRIDGNNLTFSITRAGAMTMTYEMDASVDGDSITGTAEAMGSVASWSMTRRD